MPRAKRKAVSKGKVAAKGPTAAKGEAAASPKSLPAPEPKPKPKPKSKSRKKAVSDEEPELKITVVIPKTSRKPSYFFWTDPESEGGYLSPWYTCPFEYGGVNYVSVGQYLLARRAQIARDQESMDKILLATTEEELKALGDNIKDFSNSEWVMDRHYNFHIEMANRRKFLYSDQSEDLLNRFAKLGNRELVFADPTDPDLGIGLDASEAETVDRKSWGKNAYGKSFDKLRHKIRNPISPKFDSFPYDNMW